jgi:acetyltransferase-like isoleucine patch superfamily enzyme
MSSTYDPVKSGSRTFVKEEIEKSKMLRGVNFNYFDATLTNERQRCEAALKRYNEASQISSGLTEEEKWKLLEKVVDPNKDTTHNFVVPCIEKGELATTVKIEAPFTASYGYNLRIKDGVCIHHHCNIDDAALVTIGPRTWIGPNVTIITADVRNQMQDRKGVEGNWIALPVNIESEVYIGANVTIYPGVTIGRGATIYHGATVTENLVDNERLRANGQKSFHD